MCRVFSSLLTRSVPAPETGSDGVLTGSATHAGPRRPAPGTRGPRTLPQLPPESNCPAHQTTKPTPGVLSPGLTECCPLGQPAGSSKPLLAHRPHRGCR